MVSVVLRPFGSLLRFSSHFELFFSTVYRAEFLILLSNLLSIFQFSYSLDVVSIFLVSFAVQKCLNLEHSCLSFVGLGFKSKDLCRQCHAVFFFTG